MPGRLSVASHRGKLTSSLLAHVVTRDNIIAFPQASHWVVTGHITGLKKPWVKKTVNPTFKLKQIQILKNKILDFITKFEFPDFFPPGWTIWCFLTSDSDSLWKTVYMVKCLSKMTKNPIKLIKNMNMFINLNLGLVFPALGSVAPNSNQMISYKRTWYNRFVFHIQKHANNACGALRSPGSPPKR